MNNKQIEPITFSITNTDDLLELQEFKKEHEKCREVYPDVAGALFSYTVIPTSLGDAWTVKCSCGKEIHLSRDMF